MGVDRYFESRQEAIDNYGATVAELAKAQDESAKLKAENAKLKADLAKARKRQKKEEPGFDPLGKAKMQATLHHVIKKGQLYGNLPYTHHLEAVERVLREFGENRIELLTAAWLHDIVEDTDYKIRDVRENFGDEVGVLVQAVTSDEGPNRKVRNALTYPRIRAAGVDAVRLKLADRIANVRNNGGSSGMYAKEYPEFRHALFWETGDEMVQKMWTTLDELMKG